VGVRTGRGRLALARSIDRVRAAPYVCRASTVANAVRPFGGANGRGTLSGGCERPSSASEARGRRAAEPRVSTRARCGSRFRASTRSVPGRAFGSRGARVPQRGPHLMRILLVVHGFPPSAAGGTEIYTHDLAQAL